MRTAKQIGIPTPKNSTTSTTQVFCTRIAKAWENTDRTTLRKLTPTALSQIIAPHSTEGLIDTLRFRIPYRIAPSDLVRLKGNPEWRCTELKPRKGNKTKRGEYREVRCYKFVHTATGATAMIEKVATKIAFSPVRVLERSHNLYTERPTVEQVRALIPEMTTGLFPATSRMTKTPWCLLHIALTRNFQSVGLREFLFDVLGTTRWGHSRTTTAILLHHLGFKNKVGKKVRPFRQQVTFANLGRGNKKRLTLYVKALEMAAHYFRDNPAGAEIALGLIRVESSCHGSNYVERLAPFLPPGDDIHIWIDGEAVGLKLDYLGLHAALFADLLMLLPTRARTHRQRDSALRRRRIHAVGLLVALAYPDANLTSLPQSE